MCRNVRVPKLSAADDANQLPVITRRSSSSLGGDALRESIQLLHKWIVQLSQSRRGIFFKMFDLGGAGNRQHHRRLPQQPGDWDLRGAGLQSLREILQWSARFHEIAGCEGKRWDGACRFLDTVSKSRRSCLATHRPASSVLTRY